MIQLIIVGGIAFLMQAVFSSLQMKHLNDEFLALRRRGKVAIGRKSGGFHAGAIVMFLVDDGVIQEGKKLEGVTSFARVKPLEGFEGRYVGGLTEEDGPKNHKNLCKAIQDAALNYRRIVGGETVSEPPSPLQKAGSALASLGCRDEAPKQEEGVVASE